LSLLVAAAFYVVLRLAGGGELAIAEPDQTIYLQYARNIALGQPYVFSPGDAPSTGSTTHLYLFVLAALYKLGARGEGFLLASFALNALCFAGTALMGWLVAKKIYPRAATAALFISVLAAHTATAFFSQTDVGLFSFLAMSLVAAMVYEKNRALYPLAILCAITRPEGLVFAVALLLAGLAGRSKRLVSCGLAAGLAFGATLLLNFLLTDHAQFMSVLNKGHFGRFPFSGALVQTCADLLTIFKDFFFGLPDSPRQFFHVPLLAGFLGMAGVLLRPRMDRGVRLVELWLALSVGGALLVIASSGWQGMSLDRYLAWLFPLWTLYILIGLFECSDRLKSRYFLPICMSALVGFQFLALPVVLALKYEVATDLQQQKAFYQQLDRALPAGHRIALNIGSGQIFHMPGRQVYNTSGVVSPDFFHPGGGSSAHLVDWLKHRPELRFEWWVAESHFAELGWAAPLLGEPVLVDTASALAGSALAVFPTRWDAIEGGALPVSLDDELLGRQLIDSLDVGYLVDEREHDYETWLRLRNMDLPVLHRHARLDQGDYAEAGRLIVGSESFTVRNVRPGRPLTIALRTARSGGGLIARGAELAQFSRLEMNEELSLVVFVEGEPVAETTARLRHDQFSELIMTIPAQHVDRSELPVEIGGDHFSFGYWFYQ